MIHPLRTLLILLCVAFAGFGADAQSDDYEGRPIREIDIVAPVPGTDTTRAIEGELRQTAINNIRSYVGGAFRVETVDADVARLNRLNLFATVQSSAQLLADGSVRLIFELTEQAIIQDVQATGNVQIADQDIAGVVDLLIGTPVDRFQIDRAIRRIEDLYRESGYYFARVTVDENELEESGIILFQIREGERVRITDIRFEGNDAFSARELRREIETKTAGIFRKGNIDDARLDADVGSIIRFYRDRGYLDIRADRLIQPSPDGREAILTILVDEGPLYTLRRLIIEYAGLEEGDVPTIAPPQVAGLMEIKEGDIYGLSPLRRSIQNVERALGKLGHTEANVQQFELRDPDNPLVDLRLVIFEGPAYRTGEVIISGNDLTKQNVIRRQIDLLPGRVLDTSRIDRTRALLERTRLFEPGSVKVTLQQPDEIDTDYRDVLVEIEETNTAVFSLGGAVSSDAGLVGRIALEQRNFDVADVPESFGELTSGRAFRGAGQNFQIEALPGDRIETYSISLTEPSVLDTDYSLGGRIRYRSRDFDEFDEVRFGGNIGLGRRFGTRWSGNLTFRAESVELSDIQPDRPTDIFDVQDTNLIVGLGLTFTRSTLDNFIQPTRGSRTTISVEQVGLGIGDFEFTSLDLRHSLFIPVRRDVLDRTTVVALNARLGYIPQGRDDTPTYERYYLGGQTFRGFRFRTISPRGVRNDNGRPSDDPIGGTSLVFFSAEIIQPFFEDIMSLVAFIDTGTVTFDFGVDDYRVSVGFGFRLVVQALSPAPLAFDFGFPILKEDTDEEQTFTFSVDIPF